jgi:nitrate reductase (cytochrome), electron transfer subunit
MNSERNAGFSALMAFVVISIAVVGYFVGIQSPMNPVTQPIKSDSPLVPHHSATTAIDKVSVLPAPRYSEMPNLKWGAALDRITSVQNAFSQRVAYDPTAVIVVTPEEKEFALAMRALNRAYNGAPPTVPHPVDQFSQASCVACHETGFQGETLRIPKMSHAYLQNCLQCHVESNPGHMEANEFRTSTFVGLPAPTEGPRAYPGAPPQIPHSTWMRVECLSCHGDSSYRGLQSTHPWRQNCQQCHTPASNLEQAQIGEEPEFLPPLKIEN